MTVKLKEIFFGGFNRVSVFGESGPCEAGNPSNCWGTMGGIFVGSQWKHEENPDRAAAYVRGRSMDLTVKLATHGSPEGTATLRVTGPDGLIGEASVLVNGCTPVNRTVTITTTLLPNVVKAYTRMGLTWWIQDPGAETFRRLRNTAHFVYVTLRSPRGSMLFTKNMPTKRRLNFLCYAAAQAGTDLEAIDGVVLGGPGIHATLGNNPPCDGNELNGIPPCTGSGGTIVDDWRLMAGASYVGECDEQARFMVTGVQLIGGPTGMWYKTYPSLPNDCDPRQVTLRTAAEAGITWDIDGDGTIGEENLVLRFDFPPNAGAGMNINAFEAAVEYPSLGKHYAVWPSLQATSKCGMLMAIKTMGTIQCWDPVATPEWECIVDPATGQLKTEDFPVCSAGCP